MKSSIPTCLLLAAHVYASLSSISQHPILEASHPSSTSSLIDLHRELIEHQSISANEDNVAKYLSKYLRSQNFTVELQDVGPLLASSDAGDVAPRENIFAYFGKERKTRVLVSSHIDTVPPFWPYERRGEEIWGRGSVDAKGSVAAQIIAVQELVAAGKIEEGDVALLFVVGEEVGGDGMRKANDLGLSWETAIFGEPTELKLASGHKGIMSLQVVAKGKAGHSGYPELGKSANKMLVDALYACLNVDLPYNEKYGNTTLNIGRMEGGVAGNVIAQDAGALIAIRIADGEPSVIKKIITEAVERIDDDLEVIVTSPGYGPVYIDSDVPGK